jgi:ubiquinone/menaquinone biosynthesis C-methylase UbiE
MADKGDASRFDHVDAEKDPSYFVKFLDARKAIPQDALIKQQMIDWLQPLEGKRLLDVGCGTGDDSRAIASLVGGEGRVTAIDFSAAMIAEAQRRVIDSGLPLEFREGNAMKLSFVDACFDCARAERVLMHLHDPRQALEEMIRVVRNGGTVLVSELDQETIFYDSPHIELTRRILSSLADATASPRIGRSLAGLMRSHGLQNVRSQATVLDLPFAMVCIGIAGHLEKCAKQQVISMQEADRWLQQLEEANVKGEFRGGAIVFTAAGEKA